MKLEFLILSLKNFISWARYGSCWPLTFGLACCAIEMMHSFLSKYDFDRFGIIFRNSPRHADLIIIAGTVTKKMSYCVRKLYEQILLPKWVISMGSCANGGGLYYFSYSILKGCKKILPIDIFIPGCPPSAEALMFGILQLQKFYFLKKKNIFKM